MKTKNALFCLLLILLVSCGKEESEIIIGLNDGIAHDDFIYSVSGFSIKKKIAAGNDSLVANGNFYLVTFKVVNNAVRVNHQWDNSVGYIVAVALQIRLSPPNAF